jgi:hypothetical protein
VYLLDIVAEPLEGLLALGLLGPVLEDEGKAKTVRGGQQVGGWLTGWGSRGFGRLLMYGLACMHGGVLM